MTRLAHKAAVVTGGSRGIGASVALRFAHEGAGVAIGYRTEHEAANNVVKQIRKLGVRAEAYQADVAHPQQSEEMMARIQRDFGAVDIVASCAGIEDFTTLDTLKSEDFDKVLGVNAKGQLFTVKSAIPYMGPGGRIVLTSSIAASIAVYGGVLYAASKAAVEAMVLNLSVELADKGIAINAIAPGGVETDMATQYCSKYINPKIATKISKEDWLAAHGALGRLAQAPEIAAGYAFLASDDAAYMTGRTLQIDGGFF